MMHKNNVSCNQRMFKTLADRHAIWLQSYNKKSKTKRKDKTFRKEGCGNVDFGKQVKLAARKK